MWLVCSAYGKHILRQLHNQAALALHWQHTTQAPCAWYRCRADLAQCPRYQQITMRGCMYVTLLPFTIRLYSELQRQRWQIMPLHLVLHIPMQSCWHAWPSMAKVWQISVFRAAIWLVILRNMFSLRSWRLSFLLSLFSPSANDFLPSWESLPCSLQAGTMMCLNAV